MTTFKFAEKGGVFSGHLGDGDILSVQEDVRFFDGSNDVVDTNLNLNSTNSSGHSTYMCWFRKPSDLPDSDRSILSGYVGSDGGRWDLSHRDDGSFRFQHHDIGTGSQALITTGTQHPSQWYHLAVVHDTTANTNTFYMDGELVGSTSSVTNDLTPNVDLAIGARIDGSLPVKGHIADVKVYDAALAAHEIKLAARRIDTHYDSIGAGQPDGWYSLLDSSTANLGSAGGTPSLSGATQDYDEFKIAFIPPAHLATAKDLGTNTNDASFTASLTDVTLTVQDGTKFHVGQIIKIEDELLYVSGISTNDLTVRRGICNTTVASHASGTDIFNAEASYHAGNYEQRAGKTEMLTASHMFFNGSDYITMGADQAPQAILRGSHSWAAWVRISDGQGQNRAIVGAHDETGDDSKFLLQVDSGGKIEYQYESEGSAKIAKTNNVIFANNDNEWIHVAATMSYTDSSNAVMKLFVNGQEVDLDSSDNGAFSGNMGNFAIAQEMLIGAYNNAGTVDRQWAGDLRDVKLYYKALTPAQVQDCCSGATQYIKSEHHWKLGGTDGGEDIFSQNMNDGEYPVIDSGAVVSAITGDDLCANKDLTVQYSNGSQKLGGPAAYVHNNDGDGQAWSGWQNETSFTVSQGELYMIEMNIELTEAETGFLASKFVIATGAVGSSRGSTMTYANAVPEKHGTYYRSYHIINTSGASHACIESQGDYEAIYRNVKCKRFSVGSLLCGITVGMGEGTQLVQSHIEFANGLWNHDANATMSLSNGQVDTYQYSVSGDVAIQNLGTFEPNYGHVHFGNPPTTSYGEVQRMGESGESHTLTFYNLTTNQGWNYLYARMDVRNHLTLGGYRNWIQGIPINMGYSDAEIKGTINNGSTQGQKSGGFITGSGGFSVSANGAGYTGSAQSATIQGLSNQFTCPLHNTNGNYNNHLFMQNSDNNSAYQPLYPDKPTIFKSLDFVHDWTSVTEAVAHTDATCDTNHTSNQTTVTCDANTNIKVAQTVTGTGIPANTYVTAVNDTSVTSFTISNAATATNNNTTLKFHDIANYQIGDDQCSFRAVTIQQGAKLFLNDKRLDAAGVFTVSSSGAHGAIDANGRLYLAGTHSISHSSDSTENFSNLNLIHTNMASFTDATCDTTNGSATVTLDDAYTTNGIIKEGMGVSGTGIPDQTTVLFVQDINTIILSANATASNTNTTLTFGDAPASGSPDSTISANTNPASTIELFSVQGSGSVRHSGTRDYSATPLKVLSGTYDPDAQATFGDIQGAAGATLDLDADTLIVQGDVVLTGGVLGDSALYGDKAEVEANPGSSPSKYEFSGDMTIEMWVNVPTDFNDTVSSLRYILNKDNFGYGIVVLPNGTIRWGHVKSDQNFALGRTNVMDGCWHHLAVVRDVSESNGLKIYLDGKLDGQSHNDNPSGGNNGDEVAFSINNADDANLGIDELRVFNDIRTEAEIKDNMYSEIANDAAGLVGVYHCNDASGTTLTDSTTSDTENATIQTAAWAPAPTVTFTASSSSSTATATMKLYGSSKVFKYLTGDDLMNLESASGSQTLTCVGTSQASSTVTLHSVKLSGGTLSVGAGTVKLAGEATSGFAWQRDSGTFNHNSGTIELSSNTSVHIKEDTFYNLIVAMDNDYELIWRATSGNQLTVANDFTITRGLFSFNDTELDLTVTRNLSVNPSGGGLAKFNNNDNATGVHKFNSIDVASSGTFNASNRNGNDIGKNVNGTQFASSSTATTITLEASHGVVVNDIIKIDSEEMLVTGVSTNDITVLRGVNGTSPANHANGSDVSKIGQTQLTGSNGSITRAMRVQSGATLDANSGVISFTATTDQTFEFAGTGNPHHLQIYKTDNDAIHSQNLAIDGCLDIFMAANHSWRPDSAARTLTIGEDITIRQGQFGKTTAYTGNISCANFAIVGSSVDFESTTGTLTISEDDNHAHTGRCMKIDGSCTFNHNKGTISFTSGSQPEVEITSMSLTNNPFYIVLCTNSKFGCKTDQFTVLKRLEINGCTFNGSSQFIHCEGILINRSGKYNDADVSTSTDHFAKTFILESGELGITELGMTVNTFRNIGGTLT
jgi:hypothetical protein